jgi:hypothetical protein
MPGGNAISRSSTASLPEIGRGSRKSRARVPPILVIGLCEAKMARAFPLKYGVPPPISRAASAATFSTSS